MTDPKIYPPAGYAVSQTGTGAGAVWSVTITSPVGALDAPKTRQEAVDRCHRHRNRIAAEAFIEAHDGIRHPRRSDSPQSEREAATWHRQTRAWLLRRADELLSKS